MFKPTYLYIKTHNITGLKYFGKTTAKDPYKYEGSGIYWNRHLKVHGKDISTEIIGYYTDKEECLRVAIKFSIENNIVESDDWANLKEERLDGGWDHITKEQLSLNGSFSGKKCKELKLGFFALSYEETLENLKIAREKQKQINGVDSIFSILNKNKEFNENKKKIFKEINHQQGSKNNQYGTMWIYNLELKESKKIKINESIPEGWIKGRKMFK